MKHLITYGRIYDYDYPLQEIGALEYIGKRLQFWKWYKQRTMVRPVLMLRKYKNNT
jgi:hypothetical protein